MIFAELLPAPAPPLSAECAEAMACACRAFAALYTLDDLQAQKPALLTSLKSMQQRFAHEGHAVQAAHLADAIAVLDAEMVPGCGEWDEETLENEQFRQIDQAAEHLKAARDAHIWRPVMQVEVRLPIDERIAEPA